MGLNEGLTHGSLEHLIMPLLTIDEYESKISDKRAIVVGFFVNEEAPARDLSNFIDRSSFPVLDTEVSPAPTPDGYYVTFVELQRDEDFPKTLIDILDEVDNLGSVNNWSFKCPNHEEPIDLTAENLRNNLVLDQDDMPDDVSGDEEETVVDENFWKSATVDSIIIGEGSITLNHMGIGHEFDLYKPTVGTPILVEDREARILQSMLGPAYTVFSTDGGFIVEDGNRGVFMRRAD